jgi:4-nitrophenyl phosphatase
MTALIDELKKVKLAIFDLDGVVYRGNQLIPNVNQIIKKLENLSIQVVYNSNNSTATREMYVEKLKKYNISSNINDFYTSASITATEITKLKPNATIFIIGEIGLKKELEAKGHTILTEIKNFEKIDFVIVGLDRNFNYKKLAIAQKCILDANAKFYATNSDTTLPDANRLMPGAGVMVNAVETCTSQKPIKIFGKPNPFGINLILEERNVEPENACIFGDRLNTDIVAGNKAGIITVAVLTGVATLEDIEIIKETSSISEETDKNLIPNVILKSLNEIFV